MDAAPSKRVNVIEKYAYKMAATFLGRAASHTTKMRAFAHLHMDCVNPRDAPLADRNSTMFDAVRIPAHSPAEDNNNMTMLL